MFQQRFLMFHVAFLMSQIYKNGSFKRCFLCFTCFLLYISCVFHYFKV